MLSRENRISKDKEFDRVFKTGQSFYGKVFGLKRAKNDLGLVRFGILINTKVSKKAVLRNKIRRQIREVLKSILPELRPGHDIVIIVFPLILDKEFFEIRNLLIAGLKKLGAFV